MRTVDLLALEQSAESPFWAVGETGFLTVITEDEFAPCRADSESGYFYDINKSGTAEVKLSSLIRDGSFFVFPGPFSRF